MAAWLAVPLWCQREKLDKKDGPSFRPRQHFPVAAAQCWMRQLPGGAIETSRYGLSRYRTALSAQRCTVRSHSMPWYLSTSSTLDTVLAWADLGRADHRLSRATLALSVAARAWALVSVRISASQPFAAFCKGPRRLTNLTSPLPPWPAQAQTALKFKLHYQTLARAPVVSQALRRGLSFTASRPRRNGTAPYRVSHPRARPPMPPADARLDPGCAPGVRLAPPMTCFHRVHHALSASPETG